MAENAAAPPAPVIHFPLLFSRTPLVRGESFLARVDTKGRLLEVVENDGIWMYGVNPGAVAGGGLNGTDAYVDFKKNFRCALQDMADDSSSFDEFKAKVEKFFAAASGPTEVEWNAAVVRVREGRITLPGMKKVADAKWSIEVSDVPLIEKKAEVRAPEETSHLSLVGAANSSDESTDAKVA